MSRKKTTKAPEPEKKAERKPGEFRADTLEHFLSDVLGHGFFADGGPLVARHELGESRLILVTGENATGKSMLRKVMSGALRKNEIEAIALSMQGRTSIGTFASFIYGDESSRATGCNTSNTITTAMSTSRGRTGRHAIGARDPRVHAEPAGEAVLRARHVAQEGHARGAHGGQAAPHPPRRQADAR